MKTSTTVGDDFEEEDPNDINKIIKKYESNIMILNNNKTGNKNKIKNDDLITHKNSDCTSQNSKRTKNSSNNSEKTYENNNINMKLYEEDLNKNLSSSIVNKSIKTNKNSNKINKNDIEINIIQNNIKNNNIKDTNKKNVNNKNLHNNQNVLLSLDKNYKTDKNNTSIYDTSLNILYNPYDNAKFVFNKTKNLSLLKNKIIKNIINIQEEQLKKEFTKNTNNRISKINNEDKYISKKYDKYLNKLFKKNKKGKNIKKKNKLDLKIRKKKCNCINWLIIIRNILIFIIVSSALIFYTFVFFC